MGEYPLLVELHMISRKSYDIVFCVRKRLPISGWRLKPASHNLVTIRSPKLALRPSLTQKGTRWIAYQLQPPASILQLPLQLQVWRVTWLLLLPVTIRRSPTPASKLQLRVWRATSLLLLPVTIRSPTPASNLQLQVWRVTRLLLLPVTIWSPTPASDLQLQVCSSLTPKSRRWKAIRIQPAASFPDPMLSVPLGRFRSSARTWKIHFWGWRWVERFDRKSTFYSKFDLDTNKFWVYF